MLYDIDQTFAHHWKHGPQFTNALPKSFIPPSQYTTNILSYEVASPIGIAACPLGTSKGIELMSNLGFGIFTYKTMRSVASPAHSAPNIAYLNCDKQLTMEDLKLPMITANINSSKNVAIANSFGNASFDGNIMAEDIAKTKQALSPNQLLIVSVYGSPQKDRSLIQDYILTAQIAQDAGAQVIECNISCPNISGEQPLYMQRATSYELIKKITQTIQIPLTVKIGLCPERKQLETLLINIAHAGAQGVSMINAISAQVINKSNKAYFGPSRATCGISGDPIRTLALQQIQQARDIIDTHKLDITIFGMGGITKAEHIDQFFDTGAHVAMSATGVMHNPYLAINYFNKKEHKGKNDESQRFYSQAP